MHRQPQFKQADTVLTVFRSRVNPDKRCEYERLAASMSQLARQIPGYVSHKTYAAADGEQVTIVEFASSRAQRAWSTHPEHVAAKQAGRRGLYLQYRLQVCSVTADRAFEAQTCLERKEQ